MLYTFTSYESVYDLYVAVLKTAIVAAVMLSLLVSMDRLYKVGKYMQVAARAQLTGRKPEHAFQNNALPDPEQYSLVYPRVAVQLPMFNERAVCQAIIDSACELSWPHNRFKVQVSSTCLHSLLPFELLFCTIVMQCSSCSSSSHTSDGRLCALLQPGGSSNTEPCLLCHRCWMTVLIAPLEIWLMTRL